MSHHKQHGFGSHGKKPTRSQRRARSAAPGSEETRSVLRIQITKYDTKCYIASLHLDLARCIVDGHANIGKEFPRMAGQVNSYVTLVVLLFRRNRHAKYDTKGDFSTLQPDTKTRRTPARFTCQGKQALYLFQADAGWSSKDKVISILVPAVELASLRLP